MTQAFYKFDTFGPQMLAYLNANFDLIRSQLDGDNLKHKSIKSWNIGDEQILEEALGDAAISTRAIANLAVDTQHLADLAVEAAKLAGSAVTAEKIANLAVGSAAIANLAVGTAHIANEAVIESKIGNLAVTTAKINDLAVNTAKLANASITNAKIGNLAVDSAQINSLAVTNLKIGNTAVDASKISASAVGTGLLNTATGSQTGTLDASTREADVTMNDYSFFPSITNYNDTGSDTLSRILLMVKYESPQPSTSIGKFRLRADTMSSATYLYYRVGWRYITASDNPHIYIQYDNKTGRIIKTWEAEDPLLDGSGKVIVPIEPLPGATINGYTRIPANLLSDMVGTEESEAKEFLESDIQRRKSCYKPCEGNNVERMHSLILARWGAEKLGSPSLSHFLLHRTSIESGSLRMKKDA